MSDKRVFDENGYDQNGYDKYGYNRNFEIDESSPISKREINTLKALGYENNGLNDRGFRFDGIHHITRTKYDEQGYDINGWNQAGIHMETQTEYNPKGFNIRGIHENGTPYDNNGYDIDGFNAQGINSKHFRKDGTNTYTNKKYDINGYDINGYDYDGYDINGIDQLGYNKKGFDKNGYDIFGDNEEYSYYDWKKSFNREQYIKNHKNENWFSIGFTKLNFSTKTLWGKDGYTFGDYTYDKSYSPFDDVGIDRDGYDRNGYNIEGYDREGYKRNGYNDKGINRNGRTEEQQKEFDLQEQERKVKQRRANYLGLISKAEKLAKGEMTIEEYIMKSKTSIDDLITFAKKKGLSADVIRALYKYKKTYNAYKKPFSKKEYLNSTIFLIDGKEVRPTEQDVDMCIDYLKVNGSLICDKTVSETISKYKRGEVDITIKEENLQKQIEENETIIAENEKKIQGAYADVIIAKQKKAKSQGNEISNLKSKRRYGDE